MSTNQKYINISNNFISGYNNGTEARITIASESTGKSIISLNHSTTNLGFEFLPNPVNNGIFRYRYSPTSTTTILGFDGPTMYMNITNLKTNIGSFINSNNNTVVNIFADQRSKGGSIAVNSNIGTPRIQTSVNTQQQGQIQFIYDDLGNKGTLINVSSVISKNVVASTFEVATGIVLHATDDITISSILNVGIDGALYWDGIPIGTDGGGTNQSTIVSSYSFLYTSSILTSGLIIRGRDSQETSVLRADADLNLYWNDQVVNTGNISTSLDEIFIDRIFEDAQIVNVSTLRITTSTIQGVYKQPPLPAKWFFTGMNTINADPVYVSFDDQINIVDPLENGIFSNGGNCVYGNNYSGLIIAVGNDNDNNYSTIQWTIDGLNWTNIIINNPFSASAYTVYYANNMWLIGGAVNYGFSPIIWSDDGYNFYPPLTYPSDAGLNAYSFSYDGNIFIVALDVINTAQTSLLWSDDGKIWNRIQSGGFSVKATAVFGNGQMWIACGKSDMPTSNNRIQWSLDGLNWNNALSISLGFDYGNCINYSNGLWHIGGTSSNGYNTIIVSSDGKNWESQTSGIMLDVRKIIYVKGNWYATGSVDFVNSYAILSSHDGYKWHPVEQSDFYDTNISGIYYLDNVLLGEGSIHVSPSTTMYITATMSSYTVNTSNFFTKNANIESLNVTTSAISSLYVSSIIAPNFAYLQRIRF
jgi:hypothetical protein